MLSNQTAHCGSKSIQLLRSLGVGASQNFATQPELKKETETVPSDADLKNAKPFESIPGPSKLRLFLDVMPSGPLYKADIFKMITYLYEKHGRIFRMPGMFGNKDIIMAMNPDDWHIVFRNEGIWPIRRNFKTMQYYREVHRKDFFDGVEGIITTQGEKWGRMRTKVNPILMQPKNAALYINNLLEVNNEFVERIREVRDPVTQELPANFEEDLNRLTLESVAAVALNTQLGLLRKNRDTPEAQILIKSIKRFFELVYFLDIMPSIWRYVKTPKFKELMATLDTLTDICTKYINEALVRIEKEKDGNLLSETGNERSVLEKLLKIDKKLAIVMALDMIMAGVDTTSSTIFGVLLAIAKNPAKQEKLYEELKQVLPEKNSPLTMENMRRLPYLRASIKEGMRLYPFIPGTMRQLPREVVLSGYRVPAGAEVSMGTNFLMGLEEFAPRAKEFIPERWLRDGDEEKGCEHVDHTNPFLFLPFGFGSRSCAGKRIANMELEITVARLVRNFNIEYNHPTDKPFKGLFFLVPNIPMKFKMAERKE